MEITSKSSMVSSAKAGKGFFCGEHGDAAADVSGQRLDIFQRGELDLARAGDGGEFLQIELGISRHDGEEMFAVVRAGDQRLEDLLGGRPILRATEIAVRSSGSTS
jgi:hypothetical protein